MASLEVTFLRLFLWPWACPLGQSWSLCPIRSHVLVLLITLSIKMVLPHVAHFPLSLEYSWGTEQCLYWRLIVRDCLVLPGNEVVPHGPSWMGQQEHRVWARSEVSGGMRPCKMEVPLAPTVSHQQVYS